MITLALALLLTQTPAPLVTPPPEPITPPAVAATQNEPPEVKAFAEFVGKHLLTINFSQGSFEVRQRERVFRLQDEDFETAFTLVPEALAMAQIAHHDYVVGMRLQIAGLIVVGAALVAVLVAPLVTAVFLPLLIASLIGSGIGLVVTLIALPFLLSAQSKFFAALASYNRGLLDLRPPPAMSTLVPLQGGLTFALP